MTLKNYCIDLRKELIGLISGIDDASHSFHWDNTTPNYVTKRKLKNVLQNYIARASDFGIFLITRHACSNKEHDKIEDYYLVENDYGHVITYQDPNFLWDGSQLWQGPQMSPCPCSPNKPVNEHYIIQDIIFAKDSNLDAGNKMFSILSDVHEAIMQSGDKQSRSGIREYLLRAVIRLNDLILPSPVDDYIQSISNDHCETV